MQNTVREMLLERLRGNPKLRKAQLDVPERDWSLGQKFSWHLGVVAMDAPVIFVLALACLVFLF